MTDAVRKPEKPESGNDHQDSDPLEKTFQASKEDQAKDNKTLRDQTAAKPSDLAKPLAIDASRAPAETLEKAKAFFDQSPKFQSSRVLLQQLQKDLERGGEFSGARLEKMRDGINLLMKVDPALEKILGPLAKHFEVPKITGRSDAVSEALRSPNPSERAQATRLEIERLMTMPRSSRSEADIVEIARLRRSHFEMMKDNQTRLEQTKSKLEPIQDELGKLYDKMDKGELSEKEQKRVEELAKSESGLLKQKTELERERSRSIESTVKMLKLEAGNNRTTTTQGGKITEAQVMKIIEGHITKLGLANIEIIPLGGGAMDDAGADCILLDKKTGNFLFVDPTQKDRDSESKGRLPDLRKMGVVSAPTERDFDKAPFSENHEYNDRLAEMKSKGISFKDAREIIVKEQANAMIEALKHSPLNITELHFVPATHGGVQFNEEVAAKIAKLPSQTRAAVVKDIVNYMKERERGLNELVDQVKTRSAELRKEAQSESDPVKKRGLESKARLLEEWSSHTDGSSRSHRKGSPMVYIRNVINNEVAALVNGLNPEHRDAAKESGRPGSSYSNPADGVARIKQAQADMEIVQKILKGERESSPKELAEALERLSKYHKEQSVERTEILDLKAKTEAAPSAPEQANAEPATEPRKLSEADQKGLELAKELRKQAASLELKSHAQAVQLLKSCLDEVESAKNWTEAERSQFAKLVEAYSAGDPAALEAVNKYLDLKVPAATASTAKASAEQSAERAEHETTSLEALQRKLQDPVERARVLQRIEKDGPIRETLAKAGMEESRARKLEKDLLSEDEKVRKQAELEIGKHFETANRGGFKGFAKEASGRMGALVVVAAVVLPWVFSGSAPASESESSATWTGGGGKKK